MRKLESEKKKMFERNMEREAQNWEKEREEARRSGSRL